VSGSESGANIEDAASDAGQPTEARHSEPISTPRIEEATPVQGAPPSRPYIPIAIVVGVVAVLVLGQWLLHRASSNRNHVALASMPKGVTVAEARATTYRTTNRYVGSIQPWIEAQVGPQLVAAYVRDVLVRPGAVVHRGDVLALLDCRESAAESQAVALQARAIQATQAALARQANRVAGLLDGGYVPENDVDQRRAESASEQARLQATQARLTGANLYVTDCVMRAPFDGEIGARLIDPGAFIRPGMPVVSEVDRSTVRIAVDVPETDFGVVAPGTPVRIHVVANHRDIAARVTRRSPAADPGTRTIHLEIDQPDPNRELPVNTTAEILVDVGEPVPATQIPLIAAEVRGERASVFVVDGETAHRRRYHVLGESAGNLFVEPALSAGVRVVTEGRSTLEDGDRVAPHLAAASGGE
jgi:RND family efflux transporter MFP subunit